MTDKEAMKLALFALDIVKIHYTQSRHINEAITALKEQLAQPEQLPIAWPMEEQPDGTVIPVDPSEMPGDFVFRLLATPPQRTEPPAWFPAVENILNEYGLQAIDFVADFKAAMKDAEQPQRTEEKNT